MGAYSTCPWDVAVPVRPGRFVPVFEQHRECNVVVDSGAIGAFGVGQDEVSHQDLLFADLQTNLYSHATGRLGSGRSGIFRRWYLKGIGRTPLAANWNLRDHLHNTGHLAASSAIREYVASEYLRALGSEDSVVPCVGVLLAPLEDRIRPLFELLYGNAPPGSVPRVDRAVQALSVKEAGFSRASNFVWLLHHLTPGYFDGGRTSLATLSELLTAGLSASEQSCPASGEVYPETLAELLEKAILRACGYFGRWFQAGVWWGSFCNNFTIDGRFLDLETPAIVGGPFLGVLAAESVESCRRPFKSGIVGTDIFYYLAQMRWLCEEAVRSLSKLPSAFRQIERDFASALAHEIEQRLLASEGLLACEDAAVRVALRIVVEGVGPLSLAGLSSLRELLACEHAASFGTADRRRPAEPALERVEGIGELIPEPGLRVRFHAFRLASGELLAPSREARFRAQALAWLIADLDATTDLDELGQKLAATREKVRAIVRRAGAQEEQMP